MDTKDLPLPKDLAGFQLICDEQIRGGDLLVQNGSVLAGATIGVLAQPPTKALTYDEGKEPLANLPWAAIDELSRVQAYGHKKYKDFNNYRKGMEVTRNLSCALRHIRDYLNGHDKDHESGLNPLAHALARVAFVLQNIEEGTAIDDRYKAPTKGA